MTDMALSAATAHFELAKETDLVGERVNPRLPPKLQDRGRALSTTGSRPPLTRLRFQLPLILLTAGLLPALMLGLPDFWRVTALSSASNSFALGSACALVTLLLFRRLEEFPGVTSFAQVAPATLVPYGLVLLLVFVSRLDYSRPLLILSAVNSLLTLALLWDYYRRNSVAIVYCLPGVTLSPSPRLVLQPLAEPSTKIARNSLIAANLHDDLHPGWEKFILDAALAGIPVYNAKALEEAVTGKVEVAHLSENTFGSVLPSSPYLFIKRMMDLALALIALPLVGVVLCVAGVAIKLDSKGSIFFEQERVGFRGRSFKMVKFRTMRVDPAGPAQSPLEAAKTMSADERITRVGKFLRRHRIDELPQIVNILKGDMSWIGPRPEAYLLACFYEMQIPFYGYRHMVRPGITGWAQVNQGHVVEVSDIRQKLNYDFFYIKNFSVWLDALIAARTVKILLLGKGAL